MEMKPTARLSFESINANAEGKPPRNYRGISDDYAVIFVPRGGRSMQFNHGRR